MCGVFHYFTPRFRADSGKIFIKAPPRKKIKLDVNDQIQRAFVQGTLSVDGIPVQKKRKKKRLEAQ